MIWKVTENCPALFLPSNKLNQYFFNVQIGGTRLKDEKLMVFHAKSTKLHDFFKNLCPRCGTIRTQTPFWTLWAHFALSIFRKAVEMLRTCPELSPGVSASFEFSVFIRILAQFRVLTTESCHFLWQPRHFKTHEIRFKWSYFKVWPTIRCARVKAFQCTSN